MLTLHVSFNSIARDPTTTQAIGFGGMPAQLSIRLISSSPYYIISAVYFMGPGLPAINLGNDEKGYLSRTLNEGSETEPEEIDCMFVEE